MSTTAIQRRRLVPVGLLTVGALLVSASVVAGPVFPGGTAAVAGEPETVYGATRTFSTPAYLDNAVFDEEAGLVITSASFARVVLVLDAATGAVARKVTLPASNGPIAIDVAATTVFVASRDARTLTAVDYLSGAVKYSVPVGGYPRSIVFDDERDIVWVADPAGDAVIALDSNTGAPIGDPIAVGDNPADMVLDPVSDTLYVANYDDETVSVLDAGDSTVTAVVPVTLSPSALVLAEDTHVVYATERYSETISVIAPGAEVSTTITAPDPLDSNRVIVDPVSNDLIAVSGYHPDQLVAFDRDSGKVSYRAALPRTRSLVQAPVSGDIFAIGADALSVTVLDKGQVPVISGDQVAQPAQATVPYSSRSFTGTGSGALTWSLSSTTLPQLTIDPGTGEISGTVPVKGEYVFRISLTNAYGVDTRLVNLSVAEPPQSQPGLGKLIPELKPLHKEYYEARIVVTGFPEPTLTTTGLPAGLRLSPNGYLSGTFTKVGKQSFTVTAASANGVISRKYTIAVTGAGRRGSGILFFDKDPNLDVLGRRAIRKLVHGLPDNVTVTSVSITGRMYVVGGKKSVAQKRAKSRAYAVASYVRHLGVKKQPKYSTEVGKKTQNESFGFTDLTFTYTYK